MSSSQAITPEPGERPRPQGWGPSVETAPSVLRDDGPTIARTAGTIGSFLVMFGGAFVILSRTGKLSSTAGMWGGASMAVGLVALLFHAAFDRDVQFRRLYMGFGLVTFVFGVFLALLPYPNHVGDQFTTGFGCLALALLFLMAFLRNETDQSVRSLAQSLLGGAGGLMALIGLSGSNINSDFLFPFGFLLSVLGVIYVLAFISSRGADDEFGFRVGLGVGAVGLLVFVTALLRSAIPALIAAYRDETSAAADYYMPNGLVLIAVGALYYFISLGICSDNRFVVMTRRELGAFFYSPIAYFVLLAFIIAHWVSFWWFLGILNLDEVLPEPIVAISIFQLPPVLCLIFAVPALTMRLVSEEKRSSTIEVLLTTPVDESTVILSKFVAAFIMYLTLWIPFGMYLLALYCWAPHFDYRPLFSFFMALSATGAGFIAMGLFFSSLTRNQIVAGVLTFVGMLALTMVSLARNMFSKDLNSTIWVNLINHISYLDLWQNTLEGRLVPRFLLFHVSMAFMWLFLSVKALESRKWS